jgi:hypothetical protein
MELISHRGNIEGKIIEEENKIDYILNAIDQGFDCEVDIWCKNKLFLGHDGPQYEMPMNFLFSHSSKLWIHCKNLEALEVLSRFKKLNIFWHQEDDFTLTSKGFIWTYPGKQTCRNSVIVSDKASRHKDSNCFGVCADILK